MNDRVTEIRKKQGLTQAEFAAKLGFTQANLSSIESGKSALTEANILRICDLFGVKAEWLRTGEGEMANDEAALTEKERYLLAIYRELSPKAKNFLIEYGEKLDSDEKALRGDAPSEHLA
jgi:transcriptional regulator with XRE-family HTH domain